MTTKYQMTGKLVDSVNSLSLANDYLQDDDMTKYVPESLEGIVLDVEWSLTDDISWQVRVVASRDLDPKETAELEDWISGQNSDGLGEGFEQQPFAEKFERDYWGEIDEDSWHMASFDWETNPHKLVKL